MKIVERYRSKGNGKIVLDIKQGRCGCYSYYGYGRGWGAGSGPTTLEEVRKLAFEGMSKRKLSLIEKVM